MENKKKIIIPVITILLMIIGVIGVTYAFFNYTREGLANTIAVGRIYFKHEQGNTITLENVFPISSEQAATDTVNAKTLSINVVGDTDYDKGIEYLLTIDSVNNNKNVPITLEVSVSGTGLGTNETGDYYTNRESYTESKYKIEYDDKLFNSNHILVGYIAPNTTKGTIEGINGTINIKAYIDSSKILISDTYPEGTTAINGVEYYNGTPTTNKTVLTTEEWNSITGTNALSFKIKVEANEGIWVEKEATPASCFTTSTPTPTYVRNPNMDINTCVSKITEMGLNESLQEGETLEAYCNGTGTVAGFTLQQDLDMGLSLSIANEFETSGIITNLGYTTEITDYDVNCGSDVIIPNTISTRFVSSYTRNPNMNINTCVNKFKELWGEEEEGNTVDTGETYEAFCNGTGTMWGDTFQEWLDNDWLNQSELTELENAGIIIPNTIPVQANVTIIDNNSFENKGLTSVIIPNSVITIGNNAFSYNPHLTNLSIGNNVQTIGEEVFYKNGLTSVTVPNSVLESPLKDDNNCKYFDAGVNVTWNGNEYVCEDGGK